MEVVMTSRDGNFTLIYNNINSHLSLEVTHSSLAEKYEIRISLMKNDSSRYKDYYDPQIWMSFKCGLSFNIKAANHYIDVCTEAVEFADRVQDFIETQWNIN